MQMLFSKARRQWSSLATILIFLVITYLPMYQQQFIVDEEDTFQQFMKVFNRSYFIDSFEYKQRFEIFKTSLKRIERLNEQRIHRTSALYGITEYSDMTPKEFENKIIYGQHKRTKYSIKSKYLPPNTVRQAKRDGWMHLSRSKRDAVRDDYPEVSRELTIFEPSLLQKFGITPFSSNKQANTRYKVEQNSVNKQTTTGKHVHKRFIGIGVHGFYQPSDLPNIVDWRSQSAVTEVDNQGSCGACWAHSVVEVIESMAAIKYNKQVNNNNNNNTGKQAVKLSVQQLIDCSGSNFGCDGGDTCEAVKWMVSQKVILRTDADYPRGESAGDCKSDWSLDDLHRNGGKRDEIGGKTLASYSQVPRGVAVHSNATCKNFVGKEVELLYVLARHGPFASAVDGTSWQDYLGGTVQYNCNGNRNHAVEVVGYNLTDEIPYYIVRNSWGKEFGLDGYLHIAIGRNLCALPVEVSILDVQVIY